MLDIIVCSSHQALRFANQQRNDGQIGKNNLQIEGDGALRYNALRLDTFLAAIFNQI